MKAFWNPVQLARAHGAGHGSGFHVIRYGIHRHAEYGFEAHAQSVWRNRQGSFGGNESRPAHPGAARQRLDPDKGSGHEPKATSTNQI